MVNIHFIKLANSRTKSVWFSLDFCLFFVTLTSRGPEAGSSTTLHQRRKSLIHVWLLMLLFFKLRILEICSNLVCLPFFVSVLSLV